jgi:hypothetical protein
MREAVRGCDSSLLQPDAKLVAGRKGCGELRLGSQLLAIDCSSQTSFDQAVDVAALDASGRTGGAGTISVSDGSCLVTVPSGEVMLMAPQRLDPADGVVVADFTPTKSANSVVGLEVRCSREACLDISLSTRGEYRILEVTSQKAGTSRQLAQGKLPSSAQIRPDQPNRLLVRYKGSSLVVYLNGGHLYSGRTAVPESGTVIFFNRNIEKKTSALKVGGLRIFEAP